MEDKYRTVATCNAMRNGLNDTVEKLCSKIDKFVDIQIEQSKEVYSICNKVKRLDQRQDKVELKIEDIENDTIRQSMWLKVFPTAVGVVGFISAIIVVIFRLIGKI